MYRFYSIERNVIQEIFVSVMGFASKDETNTPLTTYQNAYDRVGYFVIKTNKERIAKKEADKHRVSVTDRERVTISTRKQSGIDL